MSDKGKKKRRLARRKRKGFEDATQEKGVMYGSGAFDAPKSSFLGWEQ